MEVGWGEVLGIPERLQGIPSPFSKLMPTLEMSPDGRPIAFSPDPALKVLMAHLTLSVSQG